MTTQEHPVLCPCRKTTQEHPFSVEGATTQEHPCVYAMAARKVVTWTGESRGSVVRDVRCLGWFRLRRHGGPEPVGTGAEVTWWTDVGVNLREV